MIYKMFQDAFVLSTPVSGSLKQKRFFGEVLGRLHFACRVPFRPMLEVVALAYALLAADGFHGAVYFPFGRNFTEFH